MGDGADTLFWRDTWLGGVSFQVRFRRLFDLAVDKSCTVSHMSSRGWEVGGGLELEKAVGGVYHFTS